MRRILLTLIGAGCVFAGLPSVNAQTETSKEPAHNVVALGEGIELRDYEPMIVAEVSIEGDRRRALSRGFQRLAAYIFATDRPGAERGSEIGMTTPVIQDQLQKIAMTSPVLIQEEDNSEPAEIWRTRFVMPANFTLETLPEPPADITLAEVPARRIAAIMFNGYGRTRDLAQMESLLRDWIKGEGHVPAGPAEFAFYDNPRVPGPYRRNEVMIPIKLAEPDD